MPAITVAPVPCALRAAHRDCESYMVATLLQVTVQLPLVRLQVLSYTADHTTMANMRTPSRSISHDVVWVT